MLSDPSGSVSLTTTGASGYDLAIQRMPAAAAEFVCGFTPEKSILVLGVPRVNSPRPACRMFERAFRTGRIGFISPCPIRVLLREGLSAPTRARRACQESHRSLESMIRAGPRVPG